MGNKLSKKIASVVVTAATVLSLSGLTPLSALAQSSADLQAQINALLAQIAALQSQLAGAPAAPAASGSGDACYNYVRNLTVGSRGDDVKALQGVLASKGDLQVSPTGYFGGLTKAALAKLQAREGISPAAGYFGPITRAKVKSMCVPGAPVAGGPAPVVGGPAPVVPPVVVGGDLSVLKSETQPVATILPFNAQRVPFTNIKLVGGAKDVTVTGVKVRRTGIGADTIFDSLILLDDKGAQIGLKKTLNADHEATVGERMVVKAGEIKNLTIGGNRANETASGGQTVDLTVLEVLVDGGAKVVGTLPIVGTTHTSNTSLTVGDVTMARGPLDPSASATKEVGTTAYTFSSVKITAGSAEKVYLKFIRWNQTGSAGSGDLSNIKSYIDGVAYDMVVSSDGKYYTVTLPGKGLLIDKGFSKEALVKGDVIGGSGRSVDFDVAKRTDIGLEGELYGYGILPPQTGTADPTDDTAAFSSVEDPWYDAAQVSVSAGTMNVVVASAAAPAQNVAVNLPDQILGAWSFDVKGESISVGSMKVNVLLTEAAGSALGTVDLKSMTLVDNATGKVIQGPVDGAGTTLASTITFSSSYTFPIGVTTLVLKGKLGTDFANNDTFRASTTPSSDLTTVTGISTGVSISPTPTTALTTNTMTVKAAAITISVATVPIAQTIIAGSRYEFARYILDTSASGEDLRLTSLPLEYNLGGGSANDISNCQLYDGSVALTTGSNIVNPTAAGSSTVFTFDGNGIILSKGASKQASLKCDLKSGATGKYTWGYDSSSSPSPTGVSSGQDATITENDAAGQSMTGAAGGTLVAALDSSSPSYALVAPGQTVELSRIKFSATNESIAVRQVALQFRGAASNTPINLVGQMVELYDGATKIGEATFPGTLDTGSVEVATSSLITNFVVPRDGAKVMTIKGTIAGISVSGPNTQSGDFLIVEYDGDNNGLTGNYGVGQSSGTTITPTGGDTSSNGVRLVKAYPTFAKIDLSSSERLLTTGDDKTLYKFKVTANNGDVALYKLTFAIASSTAGGSNATTSKYSLFVFTNDSFSTPDPSYNSSANPSGLVNSGNCYGGLNSNSSQAAARTAGSNGVVAAEIYVDRTSCNGGTTTLIIPSGQTRWFRFAASIGSLALSGTSENIQVQLEGDSAFPTRHQVGEPAVGDMGRSGAGLSGTGTVDTGVDTDTNDDFIWSPISTTSSNTVFDLDYLNGFGVIGLPGSNMSPETISK